MRFLKFFIIFYLLFFAKASALIEIDGGVNIKNAPKLISSGADILVAGSYVFKSENPLETIANLKSI